MHPLSIRPFPSKRPAVAALVLLIATCVILSATAGCDTSGETDPGDPDTLAVVASFFPMYDFTRKIAGDRADVRLMVPAGSDPHTWEPTAADIADLARSDLFVYSGAGMEHWAEDVIAAAANEGLQVLEASEGIELRSGEHTNHDDEKPAVAGHGEVDPHVWLSPANAKAQMANIRDALTQADPDGAETYQANYEQWAGEADALDTAFRDALAPYVGRGIIVAHEAFGYLCDAYGLEQIAVEGLTPDSEPDPARVAEIIRIAREHDVRVVFFDKTASSKVADAIASEVGARVDVLDPAASVDPDRIENGEDWFSIMRDNLQALAAAFD